MNDYDQMVQKKNALNNPYLTEAEKADIRKEIEDLEAKQRQAQEAKGVTPQAL